ncbi:MAG: hypothetical protein KF708_17540 [Pirellulales bacterium]|nr:hypothetical protein [Pirellulales bacterium]
MTIRQRKILIVTFVLGSVLAAAVEIASACPPSGGKRRSGGGLYASSPQSGPMSSNSLYAKNRRHLPPPPAPPAQMATRDIQLASNQTPASATPVESKPPVGAEQIENPFTIDLAASNVAEAQARQQRQQAALEQAWRAEQAETRNRAAANSTAQADPASIESALQN